MRIVYAEDDAQVRETITSMLVNFGLAVHEARDGGEAVLLCRTFEPDAVLLDLGMPNMDGLETARRIRELDPDRRIRIVAITGYADAEHSRLAMLAGFDGFLAKPVSAKDVLEALRSTH
jgi:CheY-like chemotaxis protein